ncbi:MAG TPA: hypothetical protein VGJ95_15380 [Pseudonocardiaceae bacterium]|jgi:hypothetical protein
MSDGTAPTEHATPTWPDPTELWRTWWRNLTVLAPLSGNVTQTIDTGLFRAIGDQLGFVNINTAGSGDPELERRITEQVASYGRQLGRVLDLLDVLVKHTELAGIPAAERHAVDEFNRLSARIEAEKTRAAADDLDRLVGQIHRLRGDPQANAEALDRLRAALGVRP